jgi:hypothetical protein
MLTSAVSKKLIPWSQAVCRHLQDVVSSAHRLRADGWDLLLDDVALLGTTVCEPTACSGSVSLYSSVWR